MIMSSVRASHIFRKIETLITGWYTASRYLRLFLQALVWVQNNVIKKKYSKSQDFQTTLNLASKNIKMWAVNLIISSIKSCWSWTFWQARSVTESCNADKQQKWQRLFVFFLQKEERRVKANNEKHLSNCRMLRMTLHWVYLNCTGLTSSDIQHHP